jgi:peptidoglycan/xylan/chitin deacetylase (PgdA/CDA1 family)
MPATTRILTRAMKVAAEAKDRVRPPAAGGVVILIYHRVGGRAPIEIDLALASFEDQMAELAASGLVGTLDDALDHLAGRRDDGPRVVVTFDDGTDDVIDVALPVLERHRVPAVLYVATDFIDSGRSFPNDGRPASWRGLADALTTGVLSVGSHTHTHALLDRLSPVEIDDELDRSIGLLSDKLGVAPRHFAYPKAVVGSTHAEAAVRQRFESAALAGCRPNLPGATDPWRLARSPIQVADGHHYFRRKVAGGMALEQTLRNLKNRRRYSQLTH